MMRANLLKTFNNNIKEKGPMDYWFERLGGKCFINCYTPAPDSTRSLACLYTGKYPKKNGCVKRLTLPALYLKKDILNIFSLFEKYNYPMYFMLNKLYEKVGFFPVRGYRNTQIFYSLGDFLDELKIAVAKNENIFSFIGLNDYHWAVDDYGHNSRGDYYGQMHLSNCFEKIFRKIKPDIFDYIFIFSDHGCKLNEELKREKKIYLINDDRTKIVMFVRKKGCNGIKKVSRLTSIMDVLPTLVDIMDDKNSYSFDGISLFKETQNRYIVIEDQSVFASSVGMIHDLWGVRTDTHFYFSTFYGSILLKVISDNKYEEEKNPDNTLISELQEKIMDVACAYTKNMEENEILVKYRAMSTQRDKYSDGQKRRGGKGFLFRLERRLLRNKYKRW